MPGYSDEAVDRLPFNTPEKSERYRTENYRGAVGLNWYLSDPTLQRTISYYLQPDELAVVEPHLSDIGALMGGPVARWAEETDRNPARLERYDRWGHDVSQVVQPPSFIESKRAVLGAQKALRDDARQAGLKSSMPMFAANYLLDQADIGMGCALGTGGGMVKSLVAAYAPADIQDHVLAKFASGEWEGETAQLLTERAGGSDLGALETTATKHGDAWLLNGFKWFASNCDGQVFVVLAKPEGAPDSSRARPASWCCGPVATARATASGSGASKTNWVPARWPPARSSWSTRRRSCCPAGLTRSSPAANRPKRSRPMAKAWLG